MRGSERTRAIKAGADFTAGNQDSVAALLRYSHNTGRAAATAFGAAHLAPCCFFDYSSYGRPSVSRFTAVCTARHRAPSDRRDASSPRPASHDDARGACARSQRNVTKREALETYLCGPPRCCIDSLPNEFYECCQEVSLRWHDCRADSDDRMSRLCLCCMA